MSDIFHENNYDVEPYQEFSGKDVKELTSAMTAALK